MKTLMYIDGSNFRASIKDPNIKIDYIHLLKYCNKQFGDLRAYHYAQLSEGNVPLKKLLDYLSYNGYTSIEGSDGDILTDLSVDMLKACYEMKPEKLVLFSGNNLFVRPITIINDLGIKTIVISSKNSSGSLLRKTCDQFIELETFLFDLELYIKENMELLDKNWIDMGN